jgi:hypothetical protein
MNYRGAGNYPLTKCAPLQSGRGRSFSKTLASSLNALAFYFRNSHPVGWTASPVPTLPTGSQLALVALQAISHRAELVCKFANRQIAELAVQIAAQRVVVRHALDVGRGSEMAESLLDALESSLRIFEKHRNFLLNFNDTRSRAAPIRSCAELPKTRDADLPATAGQEISLLSTSPSQP